MKKLRTVVIVTALMAGSFVLGFKASQKMWYQILDDFSFERKKKRAFYSTGGR